MQIVRVLSAAGIMTCLVGCASTPPRVTSLSETVGPAPTARAGTPDQSALQVFSARQRNPVIDINMEEFRNEQRFRPERLPLRACAD